MLIDAIFGQTVPDGGLPLDIGMLVNNVGTTAFDGAPMCWESGSTYSSTKGMRSIGSARVASLRSSGCTP
jgi:hypothetical protein